MAFKQAGFRRYAADETLNFMLNRLAWDVDETRLAAIGSRASTLEEFVKAALAEASCADADGRPREAGFLHRGAEFFLPADDPRKQAAYEEFMARFYGASGSPERLEVEFQGGRLGVLDLPARGAERGVLLVCSGFDGLIEELLEVGLALCEAGYRTLLYEGPGQGGALRRHGLTMTPDWAAPTGAVLDRFGVAACTLVGVSLGGLLACRAAAFEPRVQRVVSWGGMRDFADCVAPSSAALLELGRHPVNSRLDAAAAADVRARWGLAHGMHVSGRRDPFDLLAWMRGFALDDVAPRVGQDVLIVASSDDHLVPAGQAAAMAEAFADARSVTTRLTTAAEHAAEHCQIGNPQLVVDVILLWMEGLDRRDRLLGRSALGPRPRTES